MKASLRDPWGVCRVEAAAMLWRKVGSPRTDVIGCVIGNVTAESGERQLPRAFPTATLSLRPSLPGGTNCNSTLHQHSVFSSVSLFRNTPVSLTGQSSSDTRHTEERPALASAAPPHRLIHCMIMVNCILTTANSRLLNLDPLEPWRRDLRTPRGIST